MEVLVAGLLDLSSVDYLGKPAAVIFMPGCNYNCPFCQNWEILKVKPDHNKDLNELFRFIDKASPTIDAVKITGGEPTLYPEAIKEISNYSRRKGLSFGFDTNGFLNSVVRDLIVYSNLISLDLKTSPTNPALIERVIGLQGKGNKAAENTMKSLEELLEHKEVYLDLRTTVVPGLNDDVSEFERIGELLRSFEFDLRAAQKTASYTLQEFVPEHARDESMRKLRSPSPKHLARLADATGLKGVYVKHRDAGFMVSKNELLPTTE